MANADRECDWQSESTIYKCQRPQNYYHVSNMSNQKILKGCLNGEKCGELK